MEGSNQGEGYPPPDETNAPGSTARLAEHEAAVAPEGSSGLVGAGEGPEDEDELVARDIEDAAKRHQDALDALLADDFDDEVHEEAAESAPRGAFIDTATLAATHQFLATLSGPEGSRAQALRAQLPAVPE